MRGQLDAAQHVSVAVTDAQNRGFHPEPLSESDSDLFRAAEPMLTETVMHEFPLRVLEDGDDESLERLCVCSSQAEASTTTPPLPGLHRELWKLLAHLKKVSFLLKMQR